MRSKTIAITALTMLALLLASAGGVVAQEPAPPSDEVEAQANLDTGFTYQGQLKKSGAPVNGTCDFKFSLYDGYVVGSQVGTTQTVSNVSVTNGLFTVRLNASNEFGANAFNGQARYLLIEVRCPAGSGSYTPLRIPIALNLYGRQPVTGVPYALGLRPGMRMDGTAYQNLKIQSHAATGGIPAAVTGEMYAATDGVGVYGSNSVSLAGATGAGVWGRTWSPNGRGVWGTGLNKATGVYGESDNAGCTSGVFGCGGVGGYSGTGNGVRGQTNTGVALYGYAAGNGVGLRVDGQIGGNLIEAYHGPLFQNRRFYVSNAGEVYADGNYHAGGADYAEALPAATGLEPGDVLVIGPDGKLARSTQPYQASVAGVYSAKPGFVAGAGDEADLVGNVPLAVLGIVPVKATAENGSIRPGDPLTTSSTPGHAMKAKAVTLDGLTFYPSGVLIGKALEGLDRGTGVIKMLVILQ